jgi:hypothetical protein
MSVPGLIAPDNTGAFILDRLALIYFLGTILNPFLRDVCLILWKIAHTLLLIYPFFGVKRDI